MDAFLIWAFLFGALFFGWIIGRYDLYRSQVKHVKPDDVRQVKNRLQLLFDSYSDSAIDQMLQSLEVTEETFTTHISIGKHFRKQGEVEKAILVHQNLMAHPELSQQNGDIVTFELAKDYKSAGLFDRAVALLEQLSLSKNYQYEAAVLLLDIREREKDWESAVELASQIDLKRYPAVRINLSQYFCEIAQGKLKDSLVRESEQLYKQAAQVNKQCIRALLGLANIEMYRKEYSQAIRYLKQIPEISPEDAEIIYPLLLTCTIETNSFNQYRSYLAQIFDKTGQVSALIAEGEVIRSEEGVEKAGEFIKEKLQVTPKLSLLKYLSTLLSQEEWVNEDLTQKVIDIMCDETVGSSGYRCTSCGFTSSQLLWNCPGCKSWQTIKPKLEYTKR